MTRAQLPANGLRIRSSERTITATEVEAFVGLTGDPHPIHLNAEWAKSSFFGERVAPGMMILSYSVAMAELDHARILALRRLRNVVFKRPTTFGETIHVDALVTAARELTPDVALVTLRWFVRDAADRTLIRASIEVLWSSGDNPYPYDQPDVTHG